MQLEEQLQKVLEQAGLLLNLGADTEVSVLLTDDETIRSFNLEYRGKDAPTDVLSFAMDDGDDEEPEVVGGGEEYLLGDILISVETAMRQADEFGHSLERETGFLAIHGLLHLLGFDHEQGKEAETKMRMEEERILEGIGLKR